jgi:hypothetical protein
MMIITLSDQAQAQLGKTELVVITERVDDVALLLAQMMNMGLIGATGYLATAGVGGVSLPTA